MFDRDQAVQNAFKAPFSAKIYLPKVSADHVIEAWRFPARPRTPNQLTPLAQLDRGEELVCRLNL